MNDFDAWQVEARGTAGARGSLRDDLTTAGLGIAGEAGEVADLIKKHLGHGHELDRDKLILELGDVLWYVARIADVIGVPLSAVAVENRRKLMARYPEGFSEERSKARVISDGRSSNERWDVV